MNGICRLYDIETDLKESHIIPKFAYEYTKKSGSRFLRAFANPNVRIQDGPKKYWLCQNAETEFSKRETWFTNNIFYPFLKGDKKQLKYDENLFYFVISVLWRVLLDQTEHSSLQGEPYLDRLKLVAKDWQEFLRGDKKLPDYRKVYILLTGRVQFHSIDSDEVDYYLTRTIDATIVANNPPTFVSVYAKFNRFIFWSTVLGGSSKGLSSIKINPVGGVLNFPQICNDSYMNSFFTNRILQQKKLPEISERQKKIIEDDLDRNKEKFLNSDAAEAMRNDLYLERIARSQQSNHKSQND